MLPAASPVVCSGCPSLLVVPQWHSSAAGSSHAKRLRRVSATASGEAEASSSKKVSGSFKWDPSAKPRSKRGRPPKQLSMLYDTLRAAGHLDDAASWADRITTLGRQGQWQRALAALPQMVQESLTPDGAAYGAAIRAVAWAKRWRRALSMMDTARQCDLDVTNSQRKL